MRRTPTQKGLRPFPDQEDQEDEEDQGDLEDQETKVGTPPHRLSLSPVSRAVRAEQGLEELRDQMDQMARDLEAQRRESNAKDRASEDRLLVIASLKKSLEEARLPSTGKDRAAGANYSTPFHDDPRAELREEITSRLLLGSPIAGPSRRKRGVEETFHLKRFPEFSPVNKNRLYRAYQPTLDSDSLIEEETFPANPLWEKRGDRDLRSHVKPSRDHRVDRARQPTLISDSDEEEEVLPAIRQKGKRGDRDLVDHRVKSF